MVRDFYRPDGSSRQGGNHKAGTCVAVGQAFQPDSESVRLESLTDSESLAGL
jgi:hypothetical protein